MAATLEREIGRASLSALVDLAPDSFFVADPDTHFTFCNKSAGRLLGCPTEEILGQSLMDLIPGDDVERLRQAETEMQHGATHVGEWRLRRKDGTWVPVEVHASILPGGQWHVVAHDISERKEPEVERYAFGATEFDQRWVQTIIDTMPIGVLLFHPDGPLYFNRRTEELLGVTLSASRGTKQYANEIHFPDGTPVPFERLPSSRVLRNGESITSEEYVVVRPNGERVPVLGSASPLRDAEGRVVGGIGAFQDVSERMRLENAVRENVRLLEHVFRILPVGLWIADETGRLVRTNPAGERMWAGARYLPMSEFGQYKGWWVDTGKLIQAEEWGMARAITKGETSRDEVIRIQCFDGSFKTMLHSAVPLRDEHGDITGAIVVNEDITALHDAQEKQRASEQLLRTVFELLPVGLWVADRDGKITLSNPAGTRIWGGVQYVGPEQYAEYKAWWVETGKPIAAEEWGLWRAVHQGVSSRDQLIRIQRFDGSYRTIINWAAPIRSDTGEIVGAVAVNDDVSALQHAQEQLRAAVRDREEILAIVTHDLRSPLAALMTGATVIERKAHELPGGDTLGTMARALVDVARRMSGLVEDLLAVGIATSGGRSMLKLEPIAAASLLSRAADAARPLFARRRLNLETRAIGQLPTVNVDADRILRVLANLLDNALKFTTPPGRVVIEAGTSDGGVRFAVSNSGPALPPEHLDAMFKPFWQGGRDQRGSGLGLSICRSIVEAHGGSIWAEPAEGERVRMCFVLPRTTPNT